MVDQALEKVNSLETRTVIDFETRHGKGTADSPTYHQYLAEILAVFPATYVHGGRALLQAIETLSGWLSTTDVALPSSPAMLITGFAGSGKTHATCDTAVARVNQGLPTILLLGEQFANAQPWEQIRQLVGLGGEWSREDLLTALDTSGEAAGSPAIIFVDALNETVPRSIWKTHLSAMVTARREPPMGQDLPIMPDNVSPGNDS